MLQIKKLLNKVQDETGNLDFNREQVLDSCYSDLFDYIVNGLAGGYDKDLILKLSKEKLLQTKYLLDNYC